MPRVPLLGDPALPHSQRVRLHTPDLLEHFNRFYEQLWRSTRVSAVIKELIRLRCATLNTCHY